MRDGGLGRRGWQRNGGRNLVWKRVLAGFTLMMVASGWVVSGAEVPVKPENPAKSAPVKNPPVVEKRIAWELPVLAYPNVQRTPTDSSSLSVQQFDAEMEFLAAHHFHPISMTQLNEAIVNKLALPIRPILITFDDGFASTYSSVFSTMKQYGYPFTVFMISGFINRPGYLTLAQLKEMQESGLTTIGSHTVNHLDLTAVSDDELKMEIRNSKDALSEELKRDVSFFAYTGGMPTPLAIRCAREAGYKLAFTQETGYAVLAGNPMKMKRICIAPGMSIQDFEKILSRSLRP